MKFIFLYLFISLSLILNAQPSGFEFKHVTVSNGLSSNVLYTSAQDKNGFIWFASADGLSRFDGSNFKIFKNDPQDSLSISTNWNIIAKTDSDHNLWIGTLGGGLCRFNPESETFKTFYPFPEFRGDFRKNGIVFIEEDHRKRIWVATNTAGIFRFDKLTEKFSMLFSPDSAVNAILSTQRVGGIHEFPNGIFWFSTNGGLIRFEEDKNRFRVYPLLSGSKSPDRVNYVKHDSKGRIWVSSSVGFHFLDSVSDTTPELTQFTKLSSAIRENEIFDFLEDEKGNFWVTGQNLGLAYFNPSLRTVVQFVHKTENQNTPASNSAYSLLKDKNGFIWMNTVDNGASYFNPDHKAHFKSFTFGSKNNQLKQFKSITAIHSRNDTVIWLGTDHGIVRFNRMESTFGNISTENGLSDNSVWSILQTHDGFVWAGTSAGLNRFNPVTGNITKYFQNRTDSTQLQSNVILSLLETENKKLWIGTQRGLHVYDEKKPQFHFFQPDNSNSNKLIYGLNISLFEDSVHQIWIGTNGGGMSRYNQSTGKFTSWAQHGNLETSLSNNSVVSFYEARNRRILIGTNSGGLNIFNQADGKFNHFRKKDGLVSDAVFGVFEDSNQFIWMSTPHGISRIKIKNGQISSVRNFDLSDGLATTEYGYQSFFRDRSNRLYFGGNGGLTLFHPDSISDSDEFPGLVFTGLKKFNRDAITDSSMIVKSKLDLDYSDTFFTLNFSSVCFDRKEKIRYAYKLENFDDEWIYIDSKEELSYTNLDPGNYKLLLKSTNNEGTWNPVPKVLSIYIKPPFWKTAWFISLALLMSILSVSLIIRALISRKYKKIIAQLEREKELRLAKESTREQISRDLHDDVATTLNSISLYLKTFRIRAEKNPEIVAGSIEKLDQLSEQAKESMEEVVWSLSPKNNSLSSLISRIEDMAAEICYQNSILLEFNKSVEDADESIDEAVRKNIYLIFKEFINNSVKHSEASKIKLSFSGSHQTLKMKISDNGKGFDFQNIKSKSVGGNGLTNIRKRAELLNAEISFASVPGEGTFLEIELTQMSHSGEAKIQ